jgi:hypothetical protein
LSAISDWWTGIVLAFAMPVANRVQNSMNAFAARPESVTNTPNKIPEIATIGTRFTRSASHPIGTAPSTKNAAEAVLMKTIVPSLMWNVWRISGASTLMAESSSSSSPFSAVSTANIRNPPRLIPARNVIGSD